MDKLKGFSLQDDCVSENELDTRLMLQKKNRQKKRSGGFQVLGLSQEVFKGVMKRGYKLPTPIQRKCIPLALEGRDLVAMARTGSGKTACFLIPLFEKLKRRSAKTGARALILVPTRELALQTMKFTKELGKYTGLYAALIVGGESMEDQFAAIHENPDIIIATPGRFMHVCVEMNLQLSSVVYVVFDEADRLFEMGFYEQLHEIIRRLPEARQTMLFSATLPKILVQFTKAGLSDPVLVRLDVDSKISEQLELAFFRCREENKTAVLLHLLTKVISMEQQTLVFAATKHHVEYLHMVLNCANIPNTYIYSSLDPAARKINIAKFKMKQTSVLLVTDVAARGIDIPLLDYVINYNFPATGKLFVHRVGRVARAGRSGTAFSLVAADETASLIDLHLFVGRPIKFASVHKKEGGDLDGLFGSIPQEVVDECGSTINTYLDTSSDLENMRKVCCKAYRQYLKSRPAPSQESIRRAKDMFLERMGIHPIFLSQEVDQEGQRTQLLEQVKNFKPHLTIFEISDSKGTKAFTTMRAKRQVHENMILKHQKKIEEKQQKCLGPSSGLSENQTLSKKIKLAESTAGDIEDVFQTVVNPKKENRVFKPKQKKQRNFKDEDNFIHYCAVDHHTESGLALTGDNFEHKAAGAVLDLMQDDDEEMRRQHNQSRWDKKRKKYVQGMGNVTKKVKTESGTWIRSTYQTNLYKEWKERSKVRQLQDNDSEDDSPVIENKKGKLRGLPKEHPAMVKAMKKLKSSKKGPRHELKKTEQIVKARNVREFRKKRYLMCVKKKAARKKKNKSGI